MYEDIRNVILKTFFWLGNSDLHFLTVWRMVPREPHKWKEKVSIDLHLVCTANPKRQEIVKLAQCDAMNWCIQSILRRRQWHPTPVFLPGGSHGWRSLVGCSPWVRTELAKTERLHFHFSLTCVGEGNGNPLQCSCLENPSDRRAWWAAVYGVAQSWTRLKQLSSSSSIHSKERLSLLNVQCNFKTYFKIPI